MTWSAEIVYLRIIDQLNVIVEPRRGGTRPPAVGAASVWDADRSAKPKDPDKIIAPVNGGTKC
jgi:hypothetical protein